jgi:uncharacterized protein (DUF2147 family)
LVRSFQHETAVKSLSFASTLFLVFTVGAAALPHDSPTGLWRTIDDKTHKPRGLIRIYEHEGALYGRIEASLDPAETKEFCDKCPGELRHKPMVGLVIMRGMKKHGNEYSGGEILDPDTGWTYRCRMMLEENGWRLVVRGYIGLSIAGRSQVWLRAE